MLDSTNIFDGTLPNTGVAVTSTRVSTNVLDLLAARDLGAGGPILLNGLITADFTTTNSATLQVQFEVGATAGGTYYPLLLTPVMAASNLKAGVRFLSYELPPNQLNNAAAGILSAPSSFIRLTYTVGTGVFSTGSVMAWLSAAEDRDQYTTYNNNYTAYTAPGEI